MASIWFRDPLCGDPVWSHPMMLHSLPHMGAFSFWLVNYSLSCQLRGPIKNGTLFLMTSHSSLKTMSVSSLGLLFPGWNASSLSGTWPPQPHPGCVLGNSTTVPIGPRARHWIWLSSGVFSLSQTSIVGIDGIHSSRPREEFPENRRWLATRPLSPKIMGSELERPTGVQSQGPGFSSKYYSLNSPFSGPTWRPAPGHILDSGGRTAGD